MNFLALLKQKAVRSRIGILLLLLPAGLAVTGCRRDGVQVYRVPKETTGAATATAPATAMAPNSSPAPAGWDPAPAGQMRVASFRIKGKDGKTADMGVIPLPGRAGTDLSNVNRWRGQVGLGEVDEAELAKLQQEAEIAGTKGQLYDFTGENAASGEKIRMLAAMLRKDDTAWFFKMTGDEGLVGEQKPAFLSYLKTFQFPSEAGQTGVGVAGANETQQELPPNHPPIGGSATPGLGSGSAQSAVPPTGSDAGKPAWKVPANWQETSGGQFLVAKFLIAGPNNAQAAVNVSSSGGNGGGLLMNVNRWRQQQLGLPPVDEAGANELAKPLDAGGAKAMLVDMTGQDARTNDKARIVAVMVPQGSQTWVYKLMGPVPLVEQEKDNFLKFVQTAQYKP